MGGLPAAQAAGEAYPCRTVTLVSPYPAGGTTDILARLVAPGMATELGTTVIVDNKSGASSNIGTEFVSRAAPDGCTALLGNNTGVVINRNLYPLRLDPVKSLAGVGEVASVPLLLYVNADSVPARDLAGLVKLVQQSPGKYSYASGGSGSPQHLAGELLKLDRKLDLLHVPYRGQGPAMLDVLAGQVPIAFETTTALGPHIAGGRVRVLATTAPKRIEGLPDVPTMKEAGLDRFVIENWYGVLVPARTPPALVRQLNEALNKTLRTPAVAQKLKEMGSTDVAGSPEQFDRFIQAEAPYWTTVVKRSGAKVE
ncbi:tripartite tricarboxylate transporter substrate binding protein [Xylophilus sp. Kf1]|nr:tripartite tricarboxylate transporter substrate binding protein [Xylophilus sp. Kf1]